MAAMSTALTEFSDNGNSRTYVQSGHTALEPKLVIQKRKIPQGSQVMIEDTISVVNSTSDVDSVVLPQRASVVITVRRPSNGASADTDAAVATARDIIAGDEFTAMVSTQNFLV